MTEWTSIIIYYDLFSISFVLFFLILLTLIITTQYQCMQVNYLFLNDENKMDNSRRCLSTEIDWTTLFKHFEVKNVFMYQIHCSVSHLCLCLLRPFVPLTASARDVYTLISYYRLYSSDFKKKNFTLKLYRRNIFAISCYYYDYYTA